MGTGFQSNKLGFDKKVTHPIGFYGHKNTSLSLEFLNMIFGTMPPGDFAATIVLVIFATQAEEKEG